MGDPGWWLAPPRSAPHPKRRRGVRNAPRRSKPPGSAAVGCGTLLGGANPGGTTRGEGKPREAPARGHGGGSAAARRVPCVALHLHRAERTDVLADGLGELLATPLDDPFATEVVVVPARGVERWLTQRLSHRLGAGHAARRRRLRRRRLPHPLVAASPRSAAPATPTRGPRPAGLAAARRASTTASTSRGRRRWPDHLGHGLAGERATCAAAGATPSPAGSPGSSPSYAVQRPRLLADWTGGRDTDGVRRRRRRPRRPAPGSRRCGAGWSSGSTRRRRATCTPPTPWPGCASEPATVDLPDAALAVRAHPAARPPRSSCSRPWREHRDVHLWLPHPSAALWEALADLRRRRSRGDDDHSHARVGHPLLASLGRDVRELQRTLGRRRLGRRRRPDRDPAPARHAAGLAPGRPRAPTAPRATPGRDSSPAGDRSVQVHACHGPARQVEVLREVLVGLLADDPTLEPRDILVMCPDIETYAPLIRPASGWPRSSARRGHPAHRLRVRLADRALTQTNPLLARRRAAARPRRRPGRPPARCSTWPRAPPVRRRFGFTDDDLERLARWVARVRRPLGLRRRAPRRLRAGRASCRTPGGSASTGCCRRRDVRRRPAPGSTARSRSTTSAAARSTSPAGSPSSSTGCVAATDAPGRQPPARPLAAAPWPTGSTRSPTCRPTTPGRPARSQRELARIAAEAGRRASAPLRLADVRALLGQRLRRPADPGQLPHRHAHRLHDGADALGAAPGGLPARASTTASSRGPASSTATTCWPAIRVTGERDPRSEDRQLLLDAILAATETLVVTYTGADEHTGARGRRPSRSASCSTPSTTRPPAAGGRCAERSLTRHPLQPFDAPQRRRRARLRRRPAVQLRPPPRSPGRARRPGRAVAPRAVPPRPAAAAAAETDVALDDLLGFFAHPVRGFLRSRLDVALAVRGRRARATRSRSSSTSSSSGASATGCSRDLLAGVDPADRAGEQEWRRGALPPGRLGWRVARRDRRPRRPAGAGRARPAHRARPRAVDVDVDLGGGRRLRGTVPERVRRPAGPGQLLPARRRAPAAVLGRRLLALSRRRPRPQLDRPHHRPARQRPRPRRPRLSCSGRCPTTRRASWLARPGRPARPRAARAAAAAGQGRRCAYAEASAARDATVDRGAPQGRLRLGRRPLPRGGRRLRAPCASSARPRRLPGAEQPPPARRGARRRGRPVRRAARWRLWSPLLDGPSRGAGDERSRARALRPPGAAAHRHHPARGQRRHRQDLHHRRAGHPLRRRGRRPPRRDAGRHLRPGRQPGAARAGPRASSSRPSARSPTRRAADRRQPAASRCCSTPTPPSSARGAGRLRDALADFDAATIATTHQFCQLVLRSPRRRRRHRRRRRPWSRTSTTWSSEVVDDLYLRRFGQRAERPPFDPRRGARARPRRGRRPAGRRWSRPTPIPAPAGGAPGRASPQAVRAGGRAAQAPPRGPHLRRPAQPARATRSSRRRRRRPATRMRHRWRIVLVDEFQDTDPVQWQVHRAGLRRPRDDGADRRPQAGDLRLPRRRRRHLPRGRGDRRPPRRRSAPTGAATQPLLDSLQAVLRGRRARRRADRRPRRRRPTTTSRRLGGRAAPAPVPAAGGARATSFG